MRHVFMFLCFILYLNLVQCVPGLLLGGCDGRGKEVVGWGLSNLKHIYVYKIRFDCPIKVPARGRVITVIYI